jgi:4-hydroxy-tetrahydrodipicolinate reductase
MKLAIVGYGKMGRLIESLAPEYGMETVLKLDEFNNADFTGITPEAFQGIDIAIDFSTPKAVVANVERIAALGVNIVIGTTGWSEQMERVKELATQYGIGLIWSPNFSIGVNIFSRVVSEAAHWMAIQQGYEAWAYEVHHSQKKDAPSGTLLKLVDDMRKAGYTRKIDVASNRAGAHPGTHEIGFDSAADTIELRHVARSREGFARGALAAARWLAGRKGFHEFSEVLFQ